MILSSLKNRLRSRTRVATFKFQSALDLKNRLRSRTRVATYMFQNAFNLKNRLLSRTRVINSTLNYNTKSSRNGIWCSGTRKWLQRYEIDYFCKGHISAVQPSEIPSESGRGTFGFTYPTSDIHIRPGWSLRSFRHWRLVCSELRIKTNQIKQNQSHQTKSSQINSIKLINQIKSN